MNIQEFRTAIEGAGLLVPSTRELELALLNYRSLKANCTQMGEAELIAEALKAATTMAASEQARVNEDLANAPIKLRRGDTIELESVDWLWRGYLPRAMVTILAGAPGCGKTTLALSIAAVITNGGQWPDGTPCNAPGDVVIWSGEDNASVLTARLLASGADMSRIHFVGEVKGPEGGYFDPAHDMEFLHITLAKLPNLRLLIIDPIISAVHGDSHKAAEVRRGLQPIVNMAHDQKCAVLGITHFTKGTIGRDPTERVIGSQAFGALARLVLVAAKVKAESDTGANQRRVFMRAKSNVGPDTGGFAYELLRKCVKTNPDIEGQYVHWGETLQGSALDHLNQAEAEPDEIADDAQSFLRSLLADGPIAAKRVFSEADSAGYSKDQIKRSKAKLCISATKSGMQGGWVWSLPATEGSAKNPEGSEGSDTQNSAPFAPFADKSHPSGSHTGNTERF